MDVSTLPASLTAPPAQYSEVAQSDAAKISSDFETFLVMLTAQMENQDPLNPIDSTDYATQLATFSGVEQQVLTNDLLKGLGTQLNLMGMSDLAAWVGKEARVEANAYFEGSPITISAQPDARADERLLIIRDTEGNLVSTKSVDVAAETFEWDGTNNNNEPLPYDHYKLEITNKNGGQILDTEPAKIYAEITETQTNGSDLWLILPGGEKVTADKVSALRNG